jgi:hypothetical protein
MAVEPQDAPRHAGQVVRRVLLRRNIAIDAETAQLVAAAVQAALQAGASSRLPRRARAFAPPTASRCSDMAPAIRPRACSYLITGNRAASPWRCSRRWHPPRWAILPDTDSYLGTCRVQGRRPARPGAR